MKPKSQNRGRKKDPHVAPELQVTDRWPNESKPLDETQTCDAAVSISVLLLLKPQSSVPWLNSAGYSSKNTPRTVSSVPPTLLQLRVASLIQVDSGRFWAFMRSLLLFSFTSQALSDICLSN